MANLNADQSTRSKSGVEKSNSGVSSPIAEKVTDSLHSSVDTLGESVYKAEKNIREVANVSGKTLAIQQAKLKRKWNKSGAKKYAVENPAATAGIAFAAGVLITSLLKRK